MRITARTIESRKLLLAPGKEAAFAFFWSAETQGK